MKRISSKKKVVDFASIPGKIHIGRQRGEQFRRKFELDTCDNGKLSVSVLVPEEVLSVTPSFFLGLFGKSIRNAGSREAFLEQYVFECKDHIWTTIEEGIERALLVCGPLVESRG